MRRSWKIAVSTAVMLAAPSVLSLTPAVASTDSQKFTIRATTVQSKDVDVDGDGKYSQGDVFVFSDTLKEDGEKVGTDGGVCTATRVASEKDYTIQCVVTFDLPKGQITAQSLLDAEDIERGEFTQAITGGTGSYKDAGGEMSVEFLHDGAEFTFDIDDLG
jgi:hypothetical protein